MELHESSDAQYSPYFAEDVAGILRERGWLNAEATPEQMQWCTRAASMLGHYAESREALAELLRLVFEFDAQAILQRTESHTVMARRSARDVIRRIGPLLLEPVPFSSDRFKEVVTLLKDGMGLRGRDLFHPLRLMLAGRLGEGELDRVILLLDEAATLPFRVPVKSVRTRLLEFCSTID